MSSTGPERSSRARWSGALSSWLRGLRRRCVDALPALRQIPSPDPVTRSRRKIPSERTNEEPPPGTARHRPPPLSPLDVRLPSRVSTRRRFPNHGRRFSPSFVVHPSIRDVACKRRRRARPVDVEIAGCSMRPSDTPADSRPRRVTARRDAGTRCRHGEGATNALARRERSLATCERSPSTARTSRVCRRHPRQASRPSRASDHESHAIEPCFDRRQIG